ncbi:hypothetical protein F0562_005120 [Nyssa sinensis]|uniref:Uncharacterized protein n=1 Tax=Nyssa sinensis TaxID=561372 RepID=A0A5J5AMV5_9ASTE|nr:hypothetical protein F0562_005120 [Nyssa sinensis]
MYRPVLPRAEPDLLLPGGECGRGLRVGARGPGREGPVEVRNCSLLRQSRNRGNDWRWRSAKGSYGLSQGYIAVVVTVVMVVDTVAAAAVAVDVTVVALHKS